MSTNFKLKRTDAASRGFLATARLSCIFFVFFVRIFVYIAVIRGVSVDSQRSLSPCRQCGQTCSMEFDSKEEGRLYPLLRKQVNCENIMHRMAFCPFKTIRPPPRKPPPKLMRNYTMDGHCVFGGLWYVDNSAPSAKLSYNASRFNSLLTRDGRGVDVNPYHDKRKVKPALESYPSAIKGKHVAVIGTEVPWLEAIVLNLGADKVTTMEYRNLHIEHPRVSIVTPFQYAASFLNRTAENFDSVVSYSSIEHTGLGRYGDPLMPYGDMEAIAQIWCAIKPGGYLFLALPVSGGRKQCILEWNAHRIYSYFRLQHLTANFKVLEEIATRDIARQTLYVLQKVE